MSDDDHARKQGFRPYAANKLGFHPRVGIDYESWLNAKFWSLLQAELVQTGTEASAQHFCLGTRVQSWLFWYSSSG